VEIRNICTFEKKNLKMNEKQQCYGRMKTQVNLWHSKVHK